MDTSTTGEARPGADSGGENGGGALSPSGGKVDLRSFLRAVGRSRFRSAGTLPDERPEPDVPAELCDDAGPVPVRADPARVDAFVDGIQNSLCVAWREHRPVLLQWVAAAAVGAQAQTLGLHEDLAVACGAEDHEWVQQLGGNLAVAVLTGDTPVTLARAGHDRLAARRETLERDVVAQLCSDGGGAQGVCVDGSLRGRSADSRLMGLVKTTRTRYLADETVLWRLPGGWRSPRFKLPNTGSADIYTCYLRLFDAREHAWDFGLVRVESFDLDRLDAWCARALAERQFPGAPDARWDRHLAGVRAVETVLRSRRPAVFAF